MNKARLIPIAALALAAMAAPAPVQAGNPVKPRVFLNPGHGGHNDDDRYEPFFNQAANDTVDYYESDSNLKVGQALAQLLREKGYDVVNSRTMNRTEDDLDLFEINQLAQNSGADVFYSIHSNDTGTDKRTNFPLVIYRGWTGEPAVAGSDVLTAHVLERLMQNGATTYSRGPMPSGDWTFYPNWGYKTGLGVLRYNKLPAVLTEAVFHDYLPERERLLNPDYCWNEAWAGARALDDYFGMGKRYKLGMVAGIVRLDEPRPDTETVTFHNDALQPASGAVVTLATAKGVTVATYTTDNMNNGAYSFRHVKPGKYVVTATHGGRSASAQVVVKANEAAYGNLVVK